MPVPLALAMPDLPLTVAYQGEPGAYSEQAVRRLFPGSVATGKPAFEDVFEALATGAVNRAVVPVENTLFGSVHIVYDLLRAHAVRIVAETELRIRHCLLALPGATLEALREVRSHPQALGQCAAFLRGHLPHAQAVPAHDTAGAARIVRDEGRREVAAIAAHHAAAVYGLDVLAEGIETNEQNFTRFLALARPEDAPAEAADGPAKTSVVFSLKRNVPGALFKSLAVFALRDIDLYKIESRPLVGHPGHYLFYLDVAGHEHDPELSRALGHLGEITEEVRVLGSYVAQR